MKWLMSEVIVQVFSRVSFSTMARVWGVLRPLVWTPQGTPMLPEESRNPAPRQTDALNV